MLSGKRYFQLSLVLPLVFPMILYPFALLSEVMVGLIAVLWVFLAIGGIPYLMLVFLLLIKSYYQSEEEVRTLIRLSPFLYIIIFAIFTAFVGLVKNFSEPLAPIDYLVKTYIVFTSIASIIALCLGYCYVVLVDLFYDFLYVVEEEK